MSGADRADSTAINRPPADFTSQIDAGVRGLRIGVLASQPTERMQHDVRASLGSAYRVLADAGADLVDVVLPDLTEVRAACWTIMRAEAAEYHRPHLRSRATELHPAVRTLIEGGEFIPATEYVHAQRVRGKVTAGMPMSMQVVGNAFDEAMVLRVAHAYESLTEWHRRRPPMVAGLASNVEPALR
jgi:Asp-tRNA(Asn)/Glu-tRNA(Gln) amidotransferase A subunit family amidase